MHAPLAWWCFAIQWHFVVAEAIVAGSVQETQSMDKPDGDTPAVGGAADPLGPITEQSERQKKLGRLQPIHFLIEEKL